MHPTAFGLGQGPRLIVGLRDRVQIDASAFSELQRPARDPGPAIPGEMPVRVIADVTKGLGLSYEAERDLTRALEDWLDSTDPITFRSRAIAGLRGFAPDNLAVRSEIWRRAASLYRSRAPILQRRPRSIVVQKARRGAAQGLSEGDLDAIADRQRERLAEHHRRSREDTLRWKIAEWLRANPNPDDNKVHAWAEELEMEVDDLEEAIYRLASEHARELGKADKIPGGLAAGKRRSDFDPDQVRMGIEVEMEHTDDRQVALEIALDHLAEDPRYYTHLKEMEAKYQKSAEDDWHPIPGIDGGLRRSVRGGYEYRFPAADLSPAPPPGLDRVLSQRPSPQPPELLFCYPVEELFSKGGPYIGPKGGKWADPQHTIHWKEGQARPAKKHHVVDMIVGADGGSLTLYQGNDASRMHTSPEGGSEYGIFLTPNRKYAQLYGDNLHRTWAKVANPKIVENKGEISPRDLTKQDIDRLKAQGYDSIVSISPGRPIEDADEIILFDSNQLVAHGDTSAARRVKDAAQDRRLELGIEKSLQKGAQHKYLRRVPTGKQKPRWKYIYKLPGKKPLVADEHLVEGAKLKVSHAGKLGHFEVLGHDQRRGLVRLKHDESGRKAWIKKRDLARMLEAHHARAGKEAAAATPAEEKAAPQALPRVQMADLARGEWSEVVGFEPTEQAALGLAQGLKKGWDYAAIKQPNGFMVVARRERGPREARRQYQGAPVKVHLRNEEPLRAIYVLMEADDLIASHDPVSFNVRKDYPEGVQEREYHRSKHEQGKVHRIAQKMEPVFLINNNPDGVNGTPIITQTGVVLGGNARTLGIQRAYKTEPKGAKKYRNHLIAHARDYGLSPADVRGMKSPVLVRRTNVEKKGTDHLRLLGRRMNEGMTQGMDPRVEEVALGRNFVNEHMLRSLTDRLEEGESLDGFLQKERSRPFVKALWAAGILDDQNASQYTFSAEAKGDEGLLNKEGRERLERILVGKLVDSPTLLDRMHPTQRQALANSVASIVTAQQSGWDIAPDLKRAIEIDQSIQRMEKELDAVGKPKLALQRFLSGKQRELPGVSSLAEDVRQNAMLRSLLVAVRERAGTQTMPRDFLGFALRAKEDAKKNPDLTGQADMFGGVFASKREDPAEALDIEFGITPARQKEKAAREKEARAEKKREAAARKQTKKEKQQAELAASFHDPPDLIKASEPNRIVTRAINHVEILVDAAVTASMIEHGEIHVDGAKIARRVLADIAEAVRKDPELAREQGRSPVDAQTVRGLVEAFCQMRGKDLISQSRSK